MTLRRRLADHLAGTSALEDDEGVLRHSARLARELADDVRVRPSSTLTDVITADDPLAEAFDEWRLNLVRNLAHAGLIDIALETALLLLEADPDNDVAHAADLAVTLAEQDRGGDAVRLMRERVDAQPHDAGTWAGLVEVYRVIGDDERAEAALQQAIAVADQYGEFGDVGDKLARFDEGSS